MLNHALALVLVALRVAPPCGDPNVRPATCKVPPRWVCLAPDFAAADLAEREEALAACEARRRAELAELRVVFGRDVKKLEADLAAERAGHLATLDALEGADAALNAAVAESRSRWGTWELVGFVAGALVVGAAAGGLVGWALSR